MSLPRSCWSCVAILGLWLASSRPAVEAAEAGPKPVSFVRDIRPILSRHCFACHGPDESHRKAKLRLDRKEGAFAEHDGVRPFVPGAPDDSEAFVRVTSDDPMERMPPGKDGDRLTPEQVDLLKRWIEQGAKWESHWAFEKPVRHPLPAVKDQAWARNPIDRFVLARLESEGMHPAAEADRYTLIRRVCLDLTGLPPTPEMVAQFLADRSPDAYDALVDRLLQSSAYGERWARVWLDLARYADSKGYEKDLRRSIWRYRDWVIEALNADMPYDRFTIEQLAGDLLPNAGPEQLLATAFHRNTLVNDEGGTDDEEFRVIAVKDRVDTTMQVWMGLTMGCAKCHSHKFDPITQKDYYQFYAFFNQTEDSDKGDDRPTVPIPNREQQARIERIRAEVGRLETALQTPAEDRKEAFERWTARAKARRGWSILAPRRMESASGSPMNGQLDGSVLVAGVAPAHETYTLTFRPERKSITAIRLEAVPDRSLPQGGVGRALDDGNFVLSEIAVSVRSKDQAERRLALAGAEADFMQAGYPVTHAIANPDPKKHGWAVSPEQTKPHAAVFRLKETVSLAEGDELVVRLDHQFEFSYPGFSLGRFRLAATDDALPSLEADLPQAIARIVNAPGEPTPDQARQLWRHYASIAPELAPSREQLARLRAENDAILASVRTPVLRDLAPEKQRVTRLHQRGNFLDPGEKVDPATPSGFPPLSRELPRNRLGMARWLVDSENPLTARVEVNRTWAQFFGRGLVETQEDFGSQGQPPSHPELLEWLAVEFRESGWSRKRLCKLIVTSAAYRQSAQVSPELLRKDRLNRLLSRGPRFRLDAETIRDTALATAGLLNQKMFGPSVMPYQPEGIWKSTYSTDHWETSPGVDRHRRGLYTFLKRTSPYPAMTTFDAPSREFCTVRRITTNTPLQALVTLNDPVFIEAAQALARRAVKEAGRSEREQIAHALRLALVRPARDREVDALAALYRRRLEFYRGDRAAALELAANPLGPLPNASDPSELAALTAVCNVILNLDEFLTRG